MNIKQFKRKYNLKDADIASFFGYKNAAAFRSAARKDKIEDGIIKIYQIIIEDIKKRLI